MGETTTDDGVRLHFEAAGPQGAPAVLFVHSLGTDLHLWDRQAERLSDRFRVIRYDARGHGGSDAPGGDYELARLGRDAIAVLDAAGVERASVCGISMGGAIAQWLGAEAPTRVEKLILANTGAAFGAPEMWRQRAATARADGMAPLVGPTLERWFTADWRAGRPEALDRLAEGLRSMRVAGYAGCCAALAQTDLRPRLHAVAAPTLVVVGSQDAATPPEAGRVIAEAIPAARLVSLEAAHLSPVEAPEAFDAVLEAFLAA